MLRKAVTQRLARRVGVWRHIGMTEACPCTYCMHVFMLDIQLFWSLDLTYPHLDLDSVMFNSTDSAVCSNLPYFLNCIHLHL